MFCMPVKLFGERRPIISIKGGVTGVPDFLLPPRRLCASGAIRGEFRMNGRRWFVLAMLGMQVALGAAAVAEAATMSRKEIREMPIVERPSRPGHVYGNTVRRNHSRQSR
jgi:hypothetical protein